MLLLLPNAQSKVLSPEGGPVPEVLLVKERGRWGCPGGTVDIGEDKLEAARREVLEETNCEVDPVFSSVVGGYFKAKASTCCGGALPGAVPRRSAAAAAGYRLQSVLSWVDSSIPAPTVATSRVRRCCIGLASPS